MLLGQHRAMIVHGDGLDELALHGESTIFDLEHGDIRKLTVTAEDFGLPSFPLAAIEGENQKKTENTLRLPLPVKVKKLTAPLLQ